jgi:hypothetical protein
MVSSRSVSSCFVLSFASLFLLAAIESVRRDRLADAFLPLIIALVVFTAYFQARRNFTDKEDVEDFDLEEEIY